MELAKLIVKPIGILIWPGLILSVLLMFRKQIQDRFKDIKNFELPGGFKASLRTKELALIDEVTDQQNFRDVKESNIVKEAIDTHLPFTKPLNDKSLSGSKTLLAFTANQSRKENLIYNIYYDPVGRNHNLPFKYIGLYAEKTVFAIGEVQKIVSCNYVEGKLVTPDGNELTTLSEEEKARIIGIIDNTEYYDLYYDNKFYVVDKFYKTNFTKTSDYPLRAKKYFWLDELQGFRDGMSAAEIATLLDGRNWE